MKLTRRKFHFLLAVTRKYQHKVLELLELLQCIATYLQRTLTEFQRHNILVFLVLIFIPAWLHAVANRSTVSSGPWSENEGSEKSSRKGKQFILRFQQWHPLRLCCDCLSNSCRPWGGAVTWYKWESNTQGERMRFNSSLLSRYLFSRQLALRFHDVDHEENVPVVNAIIPISIFVHVDYIPAFWSFGALPDRQATWHTRASQSRPTSFSGRISSQPTALSVLTAKETSVAVMVSPLPNALPFAHQRIVNSKESRFCSEARPRKLTSLLVNIFHFLVSTKGALFKLFSNQKPSLFCPHTQAADEMTAASKQLPLNFCVRCMF